MNVLEENKVGLLDETMERLKTETVDFFLASFSDMNGTLRAKLVPASRLSSVYDDGAGFAGFAVGDLGHGPTDPDILCIPDLSSMTVLPWKKNVAWFAGTLTEDGSPWPYCPRTILMNVMQKASNMGYEMRAGIEPEFFLLKEQEDGSITPSDDQDNAVKPCYQQQALMRNIDFLSTLITNMEEMGWSVTQADHEDGNGQFEVNFAFSDVLTSADRLSFFKYMVRTMAEERGLVATFMPKPFSTLTGSGCHTHLSLWNGNVNLFEDPEDPRGNELSELGYHFVGGLLHHAKALSAIVCPTVNSYKRLSAKTTDSGATWAPNDIAFGGNNRTKFIRLPGGRIEFRAMDGASNPYLATAAIYAAGLDGIKNEMDPDMTSRPDEQLPSTLPEALQALEQDDVLKDELGRGFIEMYITSKKEEWNQYHEHVSTWEIEKYLKES